MHFRRIMKSTCDAIFGIAIVLAAVSYQGTAIGEVAVPFIATCAACVNTPGAPCPGTNPGCFHSNAFWSCHCCNCGAGVGGQSMCGFEGQASACAPSC